VLRVQKAAAHAGARAHDGSIYVGIYVCIMIHDTSHNSPSSLLFGLLVSREKCPPGLCTTSSLVLVRSKSIVKKNIQRDLKLVQDLRYTGVVLDLERYSTNSNRRTNRGRCAHK
jgi:hypothetical protein